MIIERDEQWMNGLKWLRRAEGMLPNYLKHTAEHAEFEECLEVGDFTTALEILEDISLSDDETTHKRHYWLCMSETARILGRLDKEEEYKNRAEKCV